MGIEKTIMDLALGDGYISKPRSVNGNCLLQLKHSTKQMNYLIYKKELLESYDIRCHMNAYIDPKGYGIVYLVTGKNPIITKIRTILYSDGFKKHFTRDVLEYFDERSLAIFFQDNGSREHAKWCRNKHGKYAVKPYINTFVLHVQNFDLDSINNFMNKLKTWNIDSRIGNCKGPIICISKNDSKRIFVELVSPFICESMKYKIDAPIAFHGRL